MAILLVQLLDLVEAALNVSSGRPAGLTVEQGRLTNYENANLPHTNILPVIDDPMPREKGRPMLTERHMDFMLEHRVAVASGPFHKTLGPLLAWSVKQVLKDEAFGGLAFKTGELTTEFDGKEAPLVYGLAKQQFRVWFTNKYNDLESKS